MVSRFFEQGVLVVHKEDVESRYGLRGVRVGEASHPGPPRWPYRTTQVDEDSDVVDVAHVLQRSRRGRRRVFE